MDFRAIVVRVGIGVCVVLSNGCAHPQKLVSVDRSKVAAADASLLVQQAILTAERPPAREGASTLRIEGLPQQDVKTMARSQDLLRSQIQIEYARARETLRTRLLKFYETDLKQFSLNLQSQFDLDKTELDRQYLAEVRALFDSTSERRAPKLIRLSFLVGFPDDNPDSEPLPEDATYFEKEHEAEAKKLRSEIEAIDKEFETKAAEISSRYASILADKQTNLKSEIFRYERELNTKAEQEALAQIKSFRESVELKLKAAISASYPATPASVVAAPKVSGLPAPPKIDYSVSGISPNWVTEVADSDLRIWAPLNNYVLVPPGKGITDKTEEFIRWRRTRKLGP